MVVSKLVRENEDRINYNHFLLHVDHTSIFHSISGLIIAVSMSLCFRADTFFDCMYKVSFQISLPLTLLSLSLDIFHLQHLPSAKAFLVIDRLGMLLILIYYINRALLLIHETSSNNNKRFLFNKHVSYYTSLRLCNEVIVVGSLMSQDPHYNHYSPNS